MDAELIVLNEAISAFVDSDPSNSMTAHGGMRIYDAPLVGVAAADDSWFMRFTDPGIIGPRHMSPQEWLPGAQSIVCWFLPFTHDLRVTNRASGLPSEQWVSARIDGEAFNNALRVFVAEWLRKHDAQAIAPGYDKRFSVVDRIPNWSERHAAFVAGLGTFGLHRALITAKGSAGRLGSVITTLALPPSPRPYTHFDEYCPFLTQQHKEGASVQVKCGACIRRCPAGAISENGKSHVICSAYIDAEVLSLFAPRYGCGKCNTSVPCENSIPK